MPFDPSAVQHMTPDAIERRLWAECRRRGDLWKAEQNMDDDFAWMLYQHRKVDLSACHSCGPMYSTSAYHEHLASLVIGHITFTRGYTITHA